MSARVQERSKCNRSPRALARKAQLSGNILVLELHGHFIRISRRRDPHLTPRSRTLRRRRRPEDSNGKARGYDDHPADHGLCELTPGAAAGIAPGAAADGTAGAATGAEAVVELASTCIVRYGAAPPDPDPEDPG